MPLLTDADFQAFWSRLNATFPPFKATPEDMAHAARMWYDVLSGYSINTLHAALISVTRRTNKRPTPADLVEACQIHLKHRASVHPTTTDTRTCPCGCGGRRWYEAMFDQNHQPRRYEHGALKGEQMLRPKFHCRRVHVDVPHGAPIGQADGFDIHLPPGIPHEVADAA